MGSRQRAPRGMTSDPCPSCHGARQDERVRRQLAADGSVVGEERTRNPRPKDGICHGCAQLLLHAERIIELHKAARERRNEYVHPRDATSFRHAEKAWLSLFGWYHPLEKRLLGGLSRLALATGLPVPRGTVPRPLEGYYQGVVRMGDEDKPGARFGAGATLFTADQLAAFDELLVVVDDVARAAYAEGHAKGSSLLARLADGDLTVFDFEAEQVRVSGLGKPTG